MRKFFVAVTSLMLLSVSIPAVAEPWSFDSGRAYSSFENYVHIQESYDVGSPSMIRLMTRTSPTETRADFCLAYPNEACTESLLGNSNGDLPAGASYPYRFYNFDLVMPACEVAQDKDWCIEDLRVYSSSESPKSAKFIEAVTSATTPAVPSRGIPAGGHISLWQASEESGFAGINVAAIIQGTFVYYPFSGQNYVLQDFNLQVIPFERDLSPSYEDLTVQSPPEPFLTGIGRSMRPMPGCVWQRQGECGKRVDSPQGIRYGLTVRTDVKINSFFNGRLLDPDLKVSTTNGVTTLQVDADPVLVGEFGLGYKSDPALSRSMPALRPGGWVTKPYYENAMEAIEAFRDLAGDKASGENTIWRLSAVPVNGLNQCYEEYGVAGLVTTNATTYGAEPPKLESGFLNYKVAGMHYLSNGTDLFVGTYDLIIKSEVARCLYGYSKAPVSATVTVVGDQGAENIATTVVSERDGWLKLAAYGFTFSEKEIQVKITQPQTKTLTNYQGSATALTSKQKAEIRATVTKGGANPKFICTGIRLEGQPQALNTLVRKRAKLACDYAKSLNPKLSTFYQTKTTKARSYNGKVLVVSK